MYNYKKFLPLVFTTVLFFCFFVYNAATYAATVSLNPSADHYQETDTTYPPYVYDSSYPYPHSLLCSP